MQGRHDWAFALLIKLESQVLREKLGKKRVLLNDDQRRRMAVKGKILGRELLRVLVTIVTADTILCWHREPTHWSCASFSLAPIARDFARHANLLTY